MCCLKLPSHKPQRPSQTPSILISAPSKAHSPAATIPTNDTYHSRLPSRLKHKLTTARYDSRYLRPIKPSDLPTKQGSSPRPPHDENHALPPTKIHGFQPPILERDYYAKNRHKEGNSSTDGAVFAEPGEKPSRKGGKAKH
ncbi:MAG: hypothetical protein L6R40_007669 [Gallowayella cf. fulva]|nr:MAG: hypothetical protein L6R40_007669 [Xanthomendoza cf. fulva]